MNLLSLTNFFLIETGISDPIVSLEEAPDDVVQAAHWINTSWASFQRMRMWSFREAEAVLPVVSGTVNYTYAALERASGDLIVPGSFYSPLGNIEPVSYKQLRDIRRSATSPDLSKVTHIAVNNGILHTYPDIATSQSIAYDYWKGVQSLVADADIPYGLPDDFHSLIAHMAVARHGIIAGGQEGANLYSHHGREFKQIFQEYLIFEGIEDESLEPLVTRTLL